MQVIFCNNGVRMNNLISFPDLSKIGKNNIFLILRIKDVTTHNANNAETRK